MPLFGEADTQQRLFFLPSGSTFYSGAGWEENHRPANTRNACIQMQEITYN